MKLLIISIIIMNHIQLQLSYKSISLTTSSLSPTFSTVSYQVFSDEDMMEAPTNYPVGIFLTFLWTWIHHHL